MKRIFDILSRREKRPTDTIKAVDLQASQVASLYCPCVVSHSSFTNQRKLGNKSDNCTDQSGDTPGGGLIVRDNGVTMGPETENEQECRWRADNQTTHGDQARSQHSPWSPMFASCFVSEEHPPVFCQTTDC